MVSIVMLSTMFTLTVAGTVWIAAEWDRSVQVARMAAKVIISIALVALAVAILVPLATWIF